MARLESEKKMGYYPTPLSVVRDLRKVFKAEQGIKIFDPCCGEGIAVHEFAREKNAVTYGVELDNQRYAEAKERLDNVLNCDSIAEVYRKGSFDLLFLNPPYDWDVKTEVDSKSVRTEKRFLQRHLGSLRNMGWLVYIIPFTSLESTYKLLAQKLLKPYVFVFPEEEYRFKQVVVIGQYLTAGGKNRYDKNIAMFQSMLKYVPSGKAYQYLITTSDIPELFSVEAKGKIDVYESMRVDPEAVLHLVKKSDLYRLINEKNQSRGLINPLALLSEGHTAMLLASGAMNGRVDDLVIKGKVNAFMEEVGSEVDEAGEKEKIRSRRKYEVIVNAFDLSTGQLIRMR